VIFGSDAGYRCPACTERIWLSDIPGQEFHRRLETPIPFDCPACGAPVVLALRTRFLFRTGVLTALALAPAVFWLSGSFPVAMSLMVLGLLIMCVGLLTQTLRRNDT
jgi:hypothetical protein